jgi:aminoglycoside phosphotransferase (APT) family kinase protein
MPFQFEPVARSGDAFQQSVTASEIQAICRRVFGPDTRVDSAVELGLGLYNSTYRVSVDGTPVVLRIAPEPAKQFRSERQLMRNEYASVPWLTALAPMMPRVIAADWSHEVIGRDYVIQSFLDGVPGPEGLRAYPRTEWPAFYRQLGTIARDVHAVRGPRFGPVAEPTYAKWSEAVVASLADIAADLDSIGLDAVDVREIAAVAASGREVLDEITEPRMLAGDLWTVNVMLAEGAPTPTITGVLDLDRTWWGDPAADWTIRMAKLKPGTERDAFWETYGPPDSSPAAVWRERIYEARHIGAIRLERHRLGNAEGVRNTYADLAALLGGVHAGS